MAALRILNLEDDPLDTEIVRAELARGGVRCEITRVQTREDFLSALRSGGFDVVLAGHSLPVLRPSVYAPCAGYPAGAMY